MRRTAQPDITGWEAVPCAPGEVRIRLFGSWVVATGSHSVARIDRHIGPDTTKISFDVDGLSAWDSVLIDFLYKLERLADSRSIAVDRAGLPAGAARLIALTRAVPERQGARREQR